MQETQLRHVIISRLNPLVAPKTPNGATRKCMHFSKRIQNHLANQSNHKTQHFTLPRSVQRIVKRTIGRHPLNRTEPNQQMYVRGMLVRQYNTIIIIIIVISAKSNMYYTIYCLRRLALDDDNPIYIVLLNVQKQKRWKKQEK